MSTVPGGMFQAVPVIVPLSDKKKVNLSNMKDVERGTDDTGTPALRVKWIDGTTSFYRGDEATMLWDIFTALQAPIQFVKA